MFIIDYTKCVVHSDFPPADANCYVQSEISFSLCCCAHLSSFVPRRLLPRPLLSNENRMKRTAQRNFPIRVLITYNVFISIPAASPSSLIAAGTTAAAAAVHSLLTWRTTSEIHHRRRRHRLPAKRRVAATAANIRSNSKTCRFS